MTGLTCPAAYIRKISSSCRPSSAFLPFRRAEPSNYYCAHRVLLRRKGSQGETRFRMRTRFAMLPIPAAVIGLHHSLSLARRNAQAIARIQYILVRGALPDATSSILTKREDDAHFSGWEVNVQDRIQVGDIGQEKIPGWLFRLCVFETAFAQIQVDFAFVPGYFNYSSGVHGSDEPNHMHSYLFEPGYAAEAYAHSCRFVFPFPE
jgi:hypothetical protein